MAALLAWPRRSVLSRAEPSRAVAAGGQRPLLATRRSQQHRGEVRRRWGLMAGESGVMLGIGFCGITWPASFQLQALCPGGTESRINV